MSILINGMQTPPDGRYTMCITHDSNGGVHWVIQNQDTLEFLKHGAVIEIPEQHGRLIDESTALNARYENMNWVYDVHDLEPFLSEIPTVIPAEEGE